MLRMSQTDHPTDISDTLATLDRMAETASETPDLAQFLGETAHLIRSLVDDTEAANRSCDAWIGRCHDADETINGLRRRVEQLAAENESLTRRLAIYGP